MTGNSSSIAQSVTVALAAGKTSTTTKYIGGASGDAFENPQAVALNASWAAAKTGLEKLLASHSEEWKTIMPEESVTMQLKTIKGIGMEWSGKMLGHRGDDQYV